MSEIPVRIRAFIRRDLREELSYPLMLINETVSIAAALVMVFFLSELVGERTSRYSSEFGRDYFVFACLGLVVMDLLWVSLRGFAQRVRYYQLTGTLEACLATRIPLWQFVIFAPAFDVLKSTLRGFVFLLGALLLGASITWSGLPVAVVALSLGLAVFLGLGVVSAAVTLVVRRGDPISYFIAGSSLLFGGVLYPVEVLPEWLQALSVLVPVSPVLEAIRAALQSGAGFNEVIKELGVLLVYAGLVWVWAFAALKWAGRTINERGLGGY